MIDSIGLVSDILAEDLNGDGNSDLLINSLTRFCRYLSNGNGSFSLDYESLQQYSYNGRIDFLDLDGDDLNDIFYFSEGQFAAIYKNLGNGDFDGRMLLNIKLDGPIEVIAFDVDLDSDEDALAADLITGNIVSYWNDGSGAFSNQQVIVRDLKDVRGIVDIDFDNDGDTDIAAITRGDSSVYWFRNTGEGSFEQAGSISGNFPFATDLQQADFTGDGFNDLVISNQTVSNGQIFLAVNSGNSGFEAPVLVESDPRIGRFLHLVDLDEDGNIDLVSGKDSTLCVIYRQSNETWSDLVEISSALKSIQMAASSDINNDGRPDIVTAANGTLNNNMVVEEPTFAIFYNFGNSGFMGPVGMLNQSISTSSGGFILPVDLNLDGREDLFVSRRNGYFGYYLQEQNGAFDNIQSLTQGAFSASFENTDFNNDGRPDIYFSNFSHKNLYWYANEFGWVTQKPEESKPIDLIGFPNPTDGIFYLTGFSPMESISIRCIAADGRIILTPLKVQASGSVQIDLSELASGLYVIELSAGNTTHRNRVMKY